MFYNFLIKIIVDFLFQLYYHVPEEGDRLTLSPLRLQEKGRRAMLAFLRL